MFRLRCALVVLTVLFALAASAQTSDRQQPPASVSSAGAQQTTASQTQQNQQEKPNRIKEHFKSWCFNVVTSVCWNFGKPQQTQFDSQNPDSTQQPQRQQLPPPNQAPPRSRKGGNDEESSSHNTKIDLSPPADDAKHPGAGASDTVTEFHVYDPHKAEKDVEVGDFYFKRKNYPAAINRYRSALNWKPNDAIATFRLAQSLEKTNQLEEARQQYEAYLKILPNGPNAAEAKTAVQRLTLQSETRRDTSDKRR